MKRVGWQIWRCLPLLAVASIGCWLVMATSGPARANPDPLPPVEYTVELNAELASYEIVVSGTRAEVDLGDVAGAVTGVSGFNWLRGQMKNPMQTLNETVNKKLGEAYVAMLQPILAAMEELMGWVLTSTLKLLVNPLTAADMSNTHTSTGAAFMRLYSLMTKIAAMFALPILLLVALQAIFKRDGAILIRSLLVHLPLAFMGVALAIGIISALKWSVDGASMALVGETEIVASAGGMGGPYEFSDNPTEWDRDLTSDCANTKDGVCMVSEIEAALNGIYGAMGDTAGKSIETVGPVGYLGPGLYLFAHLVVMSVALFAGFMLFVVMLLRENAIYILALMVPFALMAFIWPALAGWLKKTAQALVAIILSKFLIVAILVLAVAIMGDLRTEHDPTQFGLEPYGAKLKTAPGEATTAIVDGGQAALDGAGDLLNGEKPWDAKLKPVGPGGPTKAPSVVGPEEALSPEELADFGAQREAARGRWLGWLLGAIMWGFAAFSPMMLLRMIPIGEAHIATTMDKDRSSGTLKKMVDAKSTASSVTRVPFAGKLMGAKGGAGGKGFGKGGPPTPPGPK